MNQDLSCPSSKFKTKANMFCFYESETQSFVVSVGMIFFFIAQITLSIWLLKRAFLKYKELTKQSERPTYHETYCTISLNILYWVRVMVVLNMVYSLVSILEFAIGEKYSEIIYRKGFQTCRNGSRLNFGVYYIVRLALVEWPASAIFFYLLLLQVQEWDTILHIIKSQRGLRNEEILYNYNSEEGVSDPISPISLIFLQMTDSQK